MRVLLIESSPEVQRAIEPGLRKAGYAVDAAMCGQEGLWYAEACDYDAIALDLRLPREGGLAILRRLRDKGQDAPVLAMTDKESLEERILCLRSGADDYIAKPFAIEDLLARVECLIRRKHGRKHPIIRFGDLEVDTNERTANWSGVPVELTPREYRLLEYLALNQGRVVSRRQIEEHLYDERSEIFSNVVEATISNLRKKLIAIGCAPLIQTRRGMGYLLKWAGDMCAAGQPG